MGCGGTVLAAQNDLPHEPLYPVKIASERVQIALLRSAENRLKLRGKLAHRRVQEIAALMAAKNISSDARGRAMLRAENNYAAQLEELKLSVLDLDSGDDIQLDSNLTLEGGDEDKKEDNEVKLDDGLDLDSNTPKTLRAKVRQSRLLKLRRDLELNESTLLKLELKTSEETRNILRRFRSRTEKIKQIISVSPRGRDPEHPPMIKMKQKNQG